MATSAPEFLDGASRADADQGGSVMLVAGARPNFMKVAPILAALERADLPHSLVHTGQHYDASMSASFFRDLAIRTPDHYLGVGSGSHGIQTARVMQAFEPVLLSERPRWLVVVGDVNSTLACALVAAKLREETGTRIAHVEAGLRSGDWRMPEEVNRVLTDRLADVLFLPSRDARQNLVAEGIQEDRIVFAGNVMVDTLMRQLPNARSCIRGGMYGLARACVGHLPHQCIDHDVSSEYDAVFLNPLGNQILPRVARRQKQQVRKPIGEHSVHFLRHAPVPTA